MDEKLSYKWGVVYKTELWSILIPVLYISGAPGLPNIPGNLETREIVLDNSYVEPATTVGNQYQELDYSYNNVGMMIQRTNARNGQTETFLYDDLNRLSKNKINTNTQKTFVYDNNGNIQTHPYIGTYTYGHSSGKPHAVSEVDFYNSASGLASSADCDVIYNVYNKAKKITENGYTLDLFYGANGQRNRTILKQGNSTLKTKYFINSRYEKEEIAGVGTRHLNYIYGENGIIAILVKTSTSASDLGTMYYVYTDHLGSYNMIVDANKNKIDSLHFDPWGNRKQYANWTVNDTRTSFLFDRGFTGHEHLDRFRIINMNGRLYDPVIARFFSPDPYVQMPDFTQNHNRYSYCFNNPLMYTDPSGEFVISFLVNAIIGWSNGENGWKAGGNAIANHFKIIGGLFTSDKNRNGWGQIWEVVSRWTWQGIQTAVGHIYSQFANMVGQIDNVSYKAGATVMSGNFWGTGSAVTIGSYIHGNHNLKPDFNNWLFQHEYGHYLQSQAVGPIYLQRYGIPSAFSGGPFKNDHDYHSVEQDANARALRYFNKHINGFADNGSWDFSSNPIIGYNESLSFNDPQNQLALKCARLQPAWHDWILGPNIILSGTAINTPVLNSKKRH